MKVKLSKAGTVINPQSAINIYIKAGAAATAAAALAPAKTLLELVAKSAAASDPDSVRTPTGYLKYKGAEFPAPYGGQLLKVGC